MAWSYPIIRVAGTTVRLHVTFLLLLGWVALIYGREGGLAAAVDGVLFVVLVFLCVVLHEFGHIAAARQYGIKTPDITLLPIGGVAQLERMPEKPWREIWVALAGPLVNVMIAAVLFLLLGAQADTGDIAQIEASQMSTLGRLAGVNVLLVVFNLIPAFPTDGGRVLRAVLTLRLGRLRATRVASIVGQVFAGIFVIVGLTGNPFLALVGIFIFLAGTAENKDVSERTAASGMCVGDAMIRVYQSLGPQSLADDAARLLLLTTQQEFPVVDDNGVMLGMVTRAAMIEAMRDRGGETPVTAFMERNVPKAQATDRLDGILDTLRTSASRTVAVLDSAGSLAGYVSRENFAEFIMLQEARGTV